MPFRNSAARLHAYDETQSHGRPSITIFMTLQNHAGRTAPRHYTHYAHKSSLICLQTKQITESAAWQPLIPRISSPCVKPLRKDGWPSARDGNKPTDWPSVGNLVDPRESKGLAHGPVCRLRVILDSPSKKVTYPSGCEDGEHRAKSGSA